MKLLTPLLLAFCCSLVSASSIPSFSYQDESSSFSLQDESPYSAEATKLITPCGSANDLLQINDITLNPDPPKKGQNLTIDFEGFLKEEVTVGTTVDIVVKFGVVQLLKKRYDFCTEIKSLGEECPIEKGDLNFVKEIAIPKQIPPGQYQVHAVVTTPAKKQVTCLDGRIVFPRK